MRIRSNNEFGAIKVNLILSWILISILIEQGDFISILHFGADYDSFSFFHREEIQALYIK